MIRRYTAVDYGNLLRNLDTSRYSGHSIEAILESVALSNELGSSEYQLTESDILTVLEAQRISEDSYIRDNRVHTTVASVLRTEEGKLHRGINMEFQTSAPLSNCAEPIAIANKKMDDGESRSVSRTDSLVAYKNNGCSRVIASCYGCTGALKEVAAQEGSNPFLIVPRLIENAPKILKVRLSDYNPDDYVGR